MGAPSNPLVFGPGDSSWSGGCSPEDRHDRSPITQARMGIGLTRQEVSVTLPPEPPDLCSTLPEDSPSISAALWGHPPAFVRLASPALHWR